MYHRILSEHAKKIFEDAAFTFVDAAEGTAASECGGAIIMGLEFSGPFRGELAIRAPEKAARTAAANMLALDEDSEDAGLRAPDAIGEILNMICGNALPEIAGTAPEFKIGAPAKISEADFSNMAEGSPDGELSEAKIFVEGCETVILMRVEGGAGAGK